MPPTLRRWCLALAACVLSTFGLSAFGLSAPAAAPTHATTGITQPGPFEVGNLLDYADSDFEGTVGDWVGLSNAMLSDSTADSFLHNASLQDTVPTAGASTFELGSGSSAVQIPVGGGDTYTVGTYFKAPATTGRSVAFGLDFFDGHGKPIKWVRTGNLNLTASGGWQYVFAEIAAPAGAASVIGSPQITYSGAAAGEQISMDEAALTPFRAAQIIGAHGPGSPYTAADWINANNTVGPLQSDKQFWTTSQPLPGQWNDPSNNCYEIEQQIADKASWPVCVITYKVQESEQQLAAFFTNLPPRQMVILVWFQEAEGFAFSGCPGAAAGSGPNFVCYFEQQTKNVRQASDDAPNVFVAVDARSHQYSNDPTHDNGTSCSFIPPTRYTDFYLLDHYDQSANGSSLPDETGSSADEWNNWLSCVKEIHKPIGLAEYGLDCTTDPNVPAVPQTMAADRDYLAAVPNATQPTIMWGYWWSDSGPFNPGCQFDNSAGALTEWRSIETQNGGG